MFKQIFLVDPKRFQVRQTARSTNCILNVGRLFRDVHVVFESIKFFRNEYHDPHKVYINNCETITRSTNTKQGLFFHVYVLIGTALDVECLTCSSHCTNPARTD